MKKLIIATIISLFVIGMAVSAYAAPPPPLTTGVTVVVGGYASWTLVPVGAKVRSTTSITFQTVDGTKASGWYYNALATLDANGDPNDGKSDVAIGVRTNSPFQLYVHKATDSLDGKLGYYVAADSAYNWDGVSSVPVVGEVLSTGFAGTTTWGTVPATAAAKKMIYDSGAVGYPDFQMGVSFALVPGNMNPTTYTTTITYTLTNLL